jgi:hypothetical protein
MILWQRRVSCISRGIESRHGTEFYRARPFAEVHTADWNREMKRLLSVQPHLKQGCQMARFQTKNPNLGKFGIVLQWKMLVYFMPYGLFTDIC